LNNGAKWTATLPQARIVEHPLRTESIGALKGECCRLALGEILVELDHDDELTPDCLAVLAETFAAGDVDFAYSNTCGILVDGGPRIYGAAWGWEVRPFVWNGRPLVQMVAFPPSPISFGRIGSSPNHVRAWRADFYHRIGGHDPTLPVLDDHDLLCRTYIEGRVRHIDQCLYIQNEHPGQSYLGPRNAVIQTRTLELLDRYMERLVGRWCKDSRLRKIDLCCGANPAAGYEGVDKRLGPIRADLNERWPFDDGTVGVFRAHDALEHLRDPIHTMREVHRCLAPNGWLLSETPSTDGRGAFQDPTHVSFWNSNSFWYYTRRQQAAMIGLQPLFQLARIVNHYPTQWHQAHEILYVRAYLLKPAGRTPENSQTN
jgi:SAM-dependent methyltransferase